MHFGKLWIMKSPMKHEVMKLEIVNKKITLQVQSSNSSLQWYPKLVWDLWITHHCPCQKTKEKKLLTTSPQTWKNYATTSSCKKNEKD
jgi:hypothetical protein